MPLHKQNNKNNRNNRNKRDSYDICYVATDAGDGTLMYTPGEKHKNPYSDPYGNTLGCSSGSHCCWILPDGNNWKAYPFCSVSKANCAADGNCPNCPQTGANYRKNFSH